ncbi:hypothetical protein NDU88_008207 [Pleurodeles waltl]|uniref:EGF-like domain-containing protein n=1 Tax=Pleurodeles waltl TaxID=8319 RepID=A0AAV7QQ33_PLEWA|nr:hypothetical protein NDU88_008207 [Pleurodeles waltl]
MALLWYNPKIKIQDPYEMECLSQGLACHKKASCHLDEVTASFYCHCLPGYFGDGYNSCEESSTQVMLANTSLCDGLGEQVCLQRRMPGQSALFFVYIQGSYTQDQIKWYKLYASKGSMYHSYRRRLWKDSGLPPVVAVLNQSLALMLYSIGEDDFYPNKFCVEVQPIDLPDKLVNVEPCDFASFGMLNASQLRYFFILDRIPIGKK